ncbi:MerR family transcriptional regulator [Lacticaseibacillus daqingensis]|uniref:MerR family transcriptional regulator n=1 Tax=Lacticaseibacillus daqingensis TaxID=2486014 RepID=UPI000F7B50D4|nr:MerR family transcriptional regulator [Lacticaseibacillus daqingensis]
MTEISALRTRPVLPISTVMALTELTARQIRYYETQELIHPARSAGNHRLYSLTDIDALIEIREQLASGFSLADIRALRHPRRRETSDSEARRMLREELMNQGRLNPNDRHTLSQGFGFRS